MLRSMCVSKPVPGKFNLRGDKAGDMSRSLNVDQRQQYIGTERRDVTYVSRLQCVQAAINHQIEELHSKQPNTKVAIISFNNEVTIIGDGTGVRFFFFFFLKLMTGLTAVLLQEPVIVTGDKLHNSNQLMEVGRAYQLTKTLAQTKASLVEKLFALEEGGSTALGPATCVAIGMAEKYPGTKQNKTRLSSTS